VRADSNSFAQELTTIEGSIMNWHLSSKQLSATLIVSIVTLMNASSSFAQEQPKVKALPSVWVLPPNAQYASPQTVAVRAGRLFDPRSGTMLMNQVVLIRGDRILEVGPNVAIPANVRVIDLSSATVLPGLIDTHVHVMDGSPLTAPGGPGVGPAGPGPAQSLTQPLQYRELVALVNAQRDLQAGFTTIVDLMTHGGWYGTVDLRDAINVGLVQGPRMQVSGPGIVATNKANAPYPLLNPQPVANIGAQVADGPWEVRKAVREQAHYGVDWIKIYSTQEFKIVDGKLLATPTYTLEETQAIVDEAHRNGLKVACHAYAGEGLRNCITAGVDVPTHGIDLDDESLKLLQKKRLPLTATLFDLSIADDADTKRFGTSRWKLMEKSFKKAYAAGIALPFGSGASPFPHGLQGDHFAYMVKWGMTPADALRSATTVAANVIGWEKDVGTVESGKYADLIAVEGNPLTDITVMSHVAFVMKGGQVIHNSLRP
jgi:imidazolonepropionase-like amidohydrolase